MTSEEYYQKEIKRLESCCSNLQAVVRGDAYNIKQLSEENKELSKVCNDQTNILTKTLAEIPVGNIVSHIFENIPEKVAWLRDACTIAETELETLQGEIEMTYRYYADFGAKKDLTTTQMLNHILKNVPNYKPTTEERDLEDMKRICDHYTKALEEIAKKNRKAETCRMIALKALGELNDDNHQPELLIEENLKLKMQVEDLESQIADIALDKVFYKL
jgi:hypothetical protein